MAYLNDVVWNDSAWPALESLNHAVSCDVCVVGLGGSGLHAIHELLQHGVDVIGIDAGMVGAGAAGSNGGFILAGVASFHHDAVAQLGNHVATALYQQTLDAIAQLKATEPQFRQTGSVRIASDDEEYADCMAQYHVMQADGLAVELYDGPAGRGLYFPHDGGFQPLARVRRMASAAVSAGARLYERTAAQHITGGQILANGHTITCKHIIVAVDGNLERLFPQLAPHVRTTRLQMLATAPDPQVTITQPVYYRYGYDYWQQLPNGSIALGGSRDRYADQEWGDNAGPTASVQAAMEATLRTVVKSTAPVTHRWAASVGYRIDDVRPLVQEIAPRLWVCGGYSGTGNLVGAICAQRIAQAIVQQSHAPLRYWMD